MHYTRPSDFERLALKKDSQTVAIDSSEECRLAALSMVRQATGLRIVFQEILWISLNY